MSIEAGAVVVVQSVPITTNVASSNPEMYSINIM